MKRVRLNPQGLARRHRGFQSCILPPKGYVLVSRDLAAGEPTCTAHFSRDPNYCYATFDGVGKEPYYADGILMVDDIYIMTMSASPLHRHLVRDVFRNERFGHKTVGGPSGISFYDDGNSFSQQWLLNKEEITKKRLPKERDLTKMLALALGYGIGPKKMVKQCYERGYALDLKVATQFRNAYWKTLFPGVRRFADYLALKVKRDGHLINPFGYRLTPTPFKAFNHMIQSTVSGLIHVDIAKISAIAPYALLETVIHDEEIWAVPISKSDAFRVCAQEATDSLNDDLKWTTKIRCGHVEGSNWYEAK